MSELTVYSFKVDKRQLERAKSFFARQETQLQDGLRDLVNVAAECELCLELYEEDASVSELQSAFATLLANAKNTWYRNSLFEEAILKIAKTCKIPLDFINNVLGEAQRIKPAVRKI